MVKIIKPVNNNSFYNDDFRVINFDGCIFYKTYIIDLISTVIWLYYMHLVKFVSFWRKIVKNVTFFESIPNLS